MKTFHIGGVHPHDNKIYSAHQPITECPLPEKAIIPLVQHIGAPAQPVVEKGQKVKVGELLAKAGGFVSANIHSPFSGTITKIDSTIDAWGMLMPAIFMDVEGNEWLETIDRTPDVVREFNLEPKEIIDRIGLPCFVKPARGGSSFGTTKVKTPEALRPAIDLALKEGEDVMIEAFMQGTEITCGCYKTKKNSVVFPITEVVSKNEFFDYAAKYNNESDEITPARISQNLTDRVQKLTSLIYDILGCHGIIRVDYIITAGDKINMLEINTTPGMTTTSFIPQQVRAAGLDIKDVLTDIIEDTLS